MILPTEFGSINVWGGMLREWLLKELGYNGDLKYVDGFWIFDSVTTLGTVTRFLPVGCNGDTLITNTARVRIPIPFDFQVVEFAAYLEAAPGSGQEREVILVVPGLGNYITLTFTAGISYLVSTPSLTTIVAGTRIHVASGGDKASRVNGYVTYRRV